MSETNAHLSPDQLVEHYYGENAPAWVAAHLHDCPLCQADYRSLQLVLNTVESAPVPERTAAYAATVWDKLAPQLPRIRRGRGRWFPLHPALALATLALLVVSAFLAGRYGAQRPLPATPPASATQVRERALLLAVGSYVERSQVVLTELVNANTPAGLPEAAQQQAEDLLEESRLYRQTAATAGDRALAGVLDELERALLAVAHPPAGNLAQQEIRQQIEDEGLLFKLRVLGAAVERRQRQLASPFPGKQL